MTGKVFAAFTHMATIRGMYPVFGAQGLEVLESGHPSVLIFRKKLKGETLIVAGSFSESGIELPPPGFLSEPAVDLLSGSRYSPGESLSFEPCALRWLYSS